MISKKIFSVVAGVILLNGALFAGEKEETKLKKIITQLCQTKPFESKIFKNTVIEQVTAITKNPAHLDEIVFDLFDWLSDIKKIINDYAEECFEHAPKTLTMDELIELVLEETKKAAQLFLDTLEPKGQRTIEHNQTNNHESFVAYCDKKRTYCTLEWTTYSVSLGVTSYYRCNKCGYSYNSESHPSEPRSKI